MKIYQASVPNKKEKNRNATVFIQAENLFEAVAKLKEDKMYIQTTKEGVGEVEAISLIRDCKIII